MSGVAQPSNQPMLSVIIPSRDRGDVIGRTVRSVIATARADLEVVVVDDGSTDHTAAQLSAIADARVRLHRLESSGNANRARNIGARLSRGALIAFLDSDDTFGPNRSDRLIEFFAHRPHVDCLVDGFIEISRRGKRIHRMPQPSPDRQGLRRMLMAHLIPLTNSAITVRRAAFEAVGGYDEDMPRHQDREFLLRLSMQHRIWLGNDSDISKYRSKQSISRKQLGYVVGMDALAERCPDYSKPEYARLFRYLIVRGIIKAIVTGHWIAAIQEFRDWRKTQHLPKDYLSCFRVYSAGRSERIRLQNGQRP